MPKRDDRDLAFADLAALSYRHHTPAAFDAPLGCNGGGGPLSGVPALLNTLLALLAVLVVMTVHAVYQLVRLPFRLLRGLFRRNTAQAH